MSKRLLYHAAFWMVYVLYKSYLNFDSVGFSVGKKSGIALFLMAVLIQLVLLLVKIPLVYALFFVADRYLSKQWSAVKTIGAVTVVFVVSLLGIAGLNQIVVNDWIYREPTDDFWNNFLSLGSLLYWLFILAFVSGIAISIKLIRLNIRQKLTQQELLQKKLELELQFLKSQSNPHFLFNTLNNIYSLARKNSDKTAEVVLKLSSLLRYMLYESARKSIEIDKEIQIIHDYIELEKLRYDQRLEVIFKNSVDRPHERIAPLILLPFVENAFKHGASESKFQSYIRIQLLLKKQQLFFEVKNSKEINDETQHTVKIGLNNIRRQLELLYPEHQLTIEDQPKEFSVQLKINLSDGNL